MDAKTDLGHEMKKAMDEVRTLRDVARLKMHLASMDAKSAWAKLEPMLEAAERDAAHASSTALHQVQETAKKLRDLVSSL
jgi:hypothetical protein